MTNRTDLVADLLMGAALADQHLSGREYETIKKLLAEILGTPTLSPKLVDRLKSFNSLGFDVLRTVRELGLTDPADKRRLVDLIASVHDADGVYDLEEDKYLRTVAQALGLEKEAYEDLTVEIVSITDLRASGAKLIGPPPLPPTR